jgi:glucan phosphoethanolaminetransferase (alkaline phosphatase superfamily)
MVQDILISWGLGVLGAFIYTMVMLWKKVKTEKSLKGVWTENKLFWAIVVVLHLAISILLSVVPDAKGAVETLTGLAFEHTPMGYVMLGILLAGGTNVTGKKIT